MRKIKKGAVLLATVAIMAAITGCSGVPKEKTIKADLEKYLDSELVGKGERISEVKIQKRTTDKKARTDEVRCIVTTEKSGISYEKEVVISYEKMDKDWEIENLTVSNQKSWKITPLKGITKKKIPASLVESTVSVDGEDWKIEKEELSEVTVEEQKTDLEKKTDKVTMKVVLDGKVEKATGELVVKYKFDKDWEVESISEKDEFKVEAKEGKALEATEDKLKEDLASQNITIGEKKEDGIVSTAAKQELNVSKEDIQDFKVEDQTIKLKGTRQTYKCSCKLVKNKVTFNLSTEMDYMYTGDWSLQPMTIDLSLESVDIAGEWKGTYKGAGDSGTAVLNIISVEGNNVTATYTYTPNNPSTFVHAGSYNASGTIDPETLMLKLQAGDWINQPDKPLSIEKQDITAIYYVDEGKIQGPGQQGFVFNVTQ